MVSSAIGWLWFLIFVIIYLEGTALIQYSIEGVNLLKIDAVKRGIRKHWKMSLVPPLTKIGEKKTHKLLYLGRNYDFKLSKTKCWPVITILG